MREGWEWGFGREILGEWGCGGMWLGIAGILWDGRGIWLHWSGIFGNDNRGGICRGLAIGFLGCGKGCGKGGGGVNFAVGWGCGKVGRG